MRAPTFQNPARGAVERGTAPLAAQAAQAGRLDWRFLLPSPRLGHVVVLGAPDAALLSALHADPTAQVEIAPRDGSGPGERIDGLVIRGAPSKAILRSLRALSGGGWVYWECAGVVPRAGGAFAPTWRVRRALRAAGYRCKAFYWARPHAAAPVEFVPLDDRDAIQRVLHRSTGKRFKYAAARIAQALCHAGWLAPWLPTAVVACRDPDAGEQESGGVPMDTMRRALAQCPGAQAWVRAAPDPPYEWRTPRFRASAHVLCFLREAATGKGTVAKIARRQDNAAALEREAAALVRLDATPVCSSVPRFLGFTHVDGHAVLLQSLVAGTTLGPPVIRARAPAVVPAVFGWCAALAASTRRDTGAAFVRQRIMESLTPWLGADAPAGTLRALALRTRDFLQGARLPSYTVFEHGDLGAPNLLLQPPAQIGVVDWELADSDGIPGADALFFFAYVAGALARARTPQEHARACEHALRSSPWIDHVLADWMRRQELAGEPAAAVFVATWARATLRAVQRTAPVGSVPAEPGPDAARAAALWKLALDRVTLLPGGG